MNDSNVKPNSNALTIDKLDNIAKQALKDYMNEIKKYGGVSHEKALYALIMEIIVTLETQHGKVDAKKVLKDIVNQVNSVA